MLKELFFGERSQASYTLETINILRLIRSENVGSRTFFSLIKLFGDASTAIENIKDFSVRGGRSKPIKVFSQSDAEKELELLEKNNAKIITYKSPEYSKLLLEIYDPPPILSYKGNIELLGYKKCVAIVGARNASANGRVFAHKIAEGLVNNDYITVSGLARGIDSAVHQANTSRTIGVIAGGIDHIYPVENKKLFEALEAEGLIIAELPIKSIPLGQHFPQRNRLISGISLGTVVIEASLKSGSLITARLALEQNKEVFAVPGFPLDPRCQGTNKLIKEGAHLVESVDDIVANLPITVESEKVVIKLLQFFTTKERSNHNIAILLVVIFTSHKEYFMILFLTFNSYANLPRYENIISKKDSIMKDFVDVNSDFKRLDAKYIKQITETDRTTIIELLSSVPLDFDYLQEATNLPLPIIYTVILELELAGRITRHHGNKISLIYK